MFARFRGIRNRLNARKKAANVELTPENSGLTKEQIETGIKALKVLGLEPKQHELSKSDIIIFLYAIGLNPTDDVIDSKLRGFKLHNHRHLTFGQLCHLWYSMVQDLTDEEEILRRAFQFFDKDGNGEISVTELRTTMHELGDMLTEDEIVSFMAIMDVNNDGVIGYHEFLNTLKTQAPELASLNAKALKQEQVESPTSLDGRVGRVGSAVGQALLRSGSVTAMGRGGVIARSPSVKSVGSPMVNSRTGSRAAPPSAGLVKDGTAPYPDSGTSISVPIGEGQDLWPGSSNSYGLAQQQPPGTSSMPGSPLRGRSASPGALHDSRVAQSGSNPRVDTSPPRAPCTLDTISPKSSPSGSDGEGVQASKQQQQPR